MRRILATCTVVVIFFTLLSTNYAQDAPQTPDGNLIGFIPIAENVERPIYVDNANDGSNRLFIVEQAGRIRIVQDGELLETPFLDITDRITPLEGFSEQGMVGFTFHPEYADNGRFFVSYTNRLDEALIVSEFQVTDDPNVADPDNERIILYITQPQSDHNGGQLAFGLDGYFYVGVGDGGGYSDPENNGQNPNNFLGAILRIDVNRDDAIYGLLRDNPFVGTGEGANEIWAYGLRNPVRFSWDEQTGDMYIPDVGQATWEEVSYLPAGHEGGANFGWPRFEGFAIHRPEVPPQLDMVLPVLAYEHSLERCAVIGGYVYHGTKIPDLAGNYVYADWCSTGLYYLFQDENAQWESNVYLWTLLNITGIGRDEAGELYFTWSSPQDNQGGLMKIVPLAEYPDAITVAPNEIEELYTTREDPSIVDPDEEVAPPTGGDDPPPPTPENGDEDEGTDTSEEVPNF